MDIQKFSQGSGDLRGGTVQRGRHKSGAEKFSLPVPVHSYIFLKLISTVVCTVLCKPP